MTKRPDSLDGEDSTSDSPSGSTELKRPIGPDGPDAEPKEKKREPGPTDTTG